jgi:hypothetical protein
MLTLAKNLVAQKTFYEAFLSVLDSFLLFLFGSVSILATIR